MMSPDLLPAIVLVRPQLGENVGGNLSRQHPEGDHLILEAEIREDFGKIARVAVPDHVPQTREIASVNR